jgi:hypothetical protein
MKLRLLVFYLMLCNFPFTAQQWEWGRSGNAIFDPYNSFFLYANKITGGNGLVYVLAFNKDTVQYATNLLTPGRMLVQYDSTGAFKWARNLPYNPRYISADGLGNIYLAGNCSNNFSTDAVTLQGDTSEDFYLIQLNAQGVEQWARRFGGSPDEHLSDIAADRSGHIYLTGSFLQNQVCDSLAFDAWVLKNPTSYGIMFVTRLNSQGQVEWASTGATDYAQNTYDYIGINLSLDPHEQPFVLGIGSGCGANCTNHIIAGFDEAGKLVYHASCYEKVKDDDIIIDFAACDNREFIFLTKDHPRYPVGVLMSRYDSLLDNQWSNLVSVNNLSLTDCCDQNIEFGLSVDLKNNIYLTGPFGYNGAGTGTYNVIGNQVQYAGGTDIAVAKYGSHGNKEWIMTAGSTGKEFSTGMYVSDKGECYVAGFYYNNSGSADIIFNTDTIVNDSPQQRLLVAKLNQEPVIAGITQYEKKLQIWPIPTTGNLIIKGLNGPSEILLRDVSGRILKTGRLNNDQENFNVKDVPPGIYFIEMREKDHSMFAKIIVDD